MNFSVSSLLKVQQGGGVESPQNLRCVELPQILRCVELPPFDSISTKRKCVKIYEEHSRIFFYLTDVFRILVLIKFFFRRLSMEIPNINRIKNQINTNSRYPTNISELKFTFFTKLSNNLT